MDEEVVEILEEVFPSEEDIISDDEETNDIEQPEDDGTIPDVPEDSGDAGGDTSPEEVEAADEVLPDENDIIDDEEENDLTEPEPAAEDEPEPQPIVPNTATLPTIGSVEAGDRVIIALINGEAVVLGGVGSGDISNINLDFVRQLASENSNSLDRTNERFNEFSETFNDLSDVVNENSSALENLANSVNT